MIRDLGPFSDLGVLDNEHLCGASGLWDIFHGVSSTFQTVLPCLSSFLSSFNSTKGNDFNEGEL